MRADEHLAERLAGADAEQLDVGLALAAGLAPDALGELADREDDGVGRGGELDAVAGEQRALCRRAWRRAPS